MRAVLLTLGFIVTVASIIQFFWPVVVELLQRLSH
jgi:hypothetical protein